MVRTFLRVGGILGGALGGGLGAVIGILLFGTLNRIK